MEKTTDNLITDLLNILANCGENYDSIMKLLKESYGYSEENLRDLGLDD